MTPTAKGTAVTSPAPGSHLTNEERKNWPAPLLPLVEAHGAEAVYSMGLATLGYPPTWTATATEFDKVRRAIFDHTKGS